jgi:4-hydroxy-tetrahydrodipicolinate reductase
MKLLIVGDGRMGRAIEALAREHGDEVVAVLGATENAHATAIASFAGRVDVAIEISVPGAAAGNVRGCLRAGIPVVCGTTGWRAEQPAVIEEAHAVAGSLLLASNFSIGVALLVELAARAGLLFSGHPQFDVALVETHHRAKLDAPSGTALTMQEAVTATLGRDVPATSVRVGSVPGTHTLLFDGPFEQISLTHEARDRRVFADGALRASRWLLGRQGVYSMRDVLGAGR